MEKEKATMENMKKDAPNQVWGCLKVVFSEIIIIIIIIIITLIMIKDE